MHETGNVFIETAEKRHADQEAWWASGTLASSSARWYVVGDYRTAFVFRRDVLRREQARRSILTIGRETSQGFLLPRSPDAVDLSAHVGLWIDREWNGTPVVPVTDADFAAILAAFGER
jgi:hypothetical protein